MSRRALSATRAADLLNFLAAHPDEPLSYAALAARLGVNQASMHSLLMALTECGYLKRDPKTRTFSLGAALVAIGDAALRENPIVDEARIEMGKLARALGMGAVALVRAGSDALCIARAGRRRARIDPPEVGQRIPIMAPLVSVFAAWGSEETAEGWLQRGSAAAADRAHARKVLEHVRRRGYSVVLEAPGRRRLGSLIADLAEAPHSETLRARLHQTIGELGRTPFQLNESEGQRHDISTITAPVFDRHGEVCVALSLQVFARDLDPDGVTEIGERLLSVTRSLSRVAPHAQ
ncbi:MAG: helix-turn-helix domain-containing protein [Myxococcota bacterium]